MAAEESKKKRRIKKVETVREKTEKSTTAKPKPHRIKRAASGVKRPIIAARNVARKEYHIVKPKEGKESGFFTKSRRLTPGFLVNAWKELRQVTWPSRGETFKLTLAVLIFAVVLGLAIAGVDYLLQKLFREVIL